MEKTAFITGASGYIGSHVASAFREAGYRVRGLTRSEATAMALRARGVEPVVGSLQDVASWRAVAERADVLVHAAVDYQADTFALDRETVDQLNVIATTTDARFIYTSGIWVAGNTAGKVVDESVAPNPIPLVETRVATEAAVRSAGGIVIRPGVVYGERGGLTGSWFAGEAIVGDGDNRWAMVHAADLALAYVLAAEKGAPGELLNVVDDSRLTVAEMASAARQAAGIRGELEKLPYPDAKGRVGEFADALAIDQRVSNAKVKRLLGWSPRKPDFVHGIVSYFDDWQKSVRAAA